MRVGACLRVSSEEQISGYSLDAQRRAIEGFYAARGWGEITWYEDAGRFAYADDLAKRSAFARLLGDAEAGAFDVVLVHKGDRRDLEQQRQRAWRRCEAYAAGTDPDAPPTPAPVVRSTWQVRSGDAA